MDRKINWHKQPLIAPHKPLGPPLARLLAPPAFWAGHMADVDTWDEPAGPLIYQMIDALTGSVADSIEPAHVRLAAAFGAPQDADLIRRALVLCADHELNASTFAARVAASAGATLPSRSLSRVRNPHPDSVIRFTPPQIPALQK